MTTLRRRISVAVVVVLLAGTSGATAWAAMPTDETTTAGPDDAEFVTDGDDLVFEQARNQTIRGETTLEPGTNLSLSVEGEDFYMAQMVTVTERGTFEGVFDFSETAGGEQLEITLRHDRTTLAETTGEIDPCPNGCEPQTTNPTDDTTKRLENDIFVETLIEVEQNRTASIGVLFGDAEVLTVSIGGPEVNYVVNGTIRDRDGDGEATVLFHTDRAGSDAPTLGVVDDGETRVVEANDETSLDSPLAPASYDVRLYRGQNATGEPDAKGGQVVIYDAAGSEPTEETNAPETTTATTAVTDEVDTTIQGADESGNRFVTGIGMLALGGVLAVAGIGVLLGVFRN